MQLTLELTIKSQYNEATDINEVQLSFDKSNSMSEVFTALRIAKDSLSNALEAYVKVMPEGILTEKQLDELVNTPIKLLKGFEI